MSHRHRLRAGGVPRPSEKDLRKWDRLLTRAALAARDPLRNAASFRTAAEAAYRAVLPLGHQGASSPFVQLTAIGRAYEADATSGPRIEALVERCREALSDRAPDPRRDVFG